MSELAAKLTEDLPPKRSTAKSKKLDTLDDDDQQAVVNLHTEAGYSASDIADILTERGFPISSNPVRAWLRSKGALRSS